MSHGPVAAVATRSMTPGSSPCASAALLQETARAERLDLPELTRRLGAWIGGQEAPPGEEGVQRLERDAAAVQVMTMH